MALVNLQSMYQSLRSIPLVSCFTTLQSFFPDLSRGTVNVLFNLFQILLALQPESLPLKLPRML